MHKFLFTLLLSFGVLVSVSAQITITPDHKTASYNVGETIVFNIHSTITGPATYEIRYSEQTKVLEKGKLDVVANQDYQITFVPQEPCFLICKVYVSGNEGIAGVSVSPFDIMPFEDTPADFDEFWANQKAQLAQIPIDPQLTLFSETGASTTYKISLASIDNRRVYGYLSVPKVNEPMAAVLQVPAYGSAPGNAQPVPWIAENLGAIILNISIHNAPPDQQDPNAYQPNDPSIREKNYYRYAFMAAVRAIDYIFTRPDFDGKELAVYGISQGGGLALCTAGLDQRVKLLVDIVPALCRHDGQRYGRPSGHPFYIATSRFTVGTPEHEYATTEATKYYDAVNFAKRFTGPSLSMFGYLDQTCPAETGFTANNQLLNSKMIIHQRDKGHNSFFLGPYDLYRFIRGYFTDLHSKYPPADSSTWYVMDAGGGQTTSVNTDIDLEANLTLDQQATTSLPVEWQKVSGPGAVHFSTPYKYLTKASFSKPGSYLLRVVATDNALLDSDGVWMQIVDYVWIQVN